MKSGNPACSPQSLPLALVTDLREAGICTSHAASLVTEISVMDFWADERFDCADPTNERIWAESPARGAQLAVAYGASTIGGWQDRWATPRLPWVPDVVGQRWLASGRVIVLGSAYAPFVRGASDRPAAMPLADYADATSASVFTRRFLHHVVRPDGTYYRCVRTLFEGLVVPQEMLVSDLCRASFVQAMGEGRFRGGDEVVDAGKGLFDAWVDAGADWTLERLVQGPASVVVALGDVAWRSLHRIVRRDGGRVDERGCGARNLRYPQALTCRIELRGKVLHGVKAAHPTWANKNDRGYAVARHVLAELLGVAMPSPTVIAPTGASRLPSRRSEADSRPSRRGRVVGLHFVCRGHKNVHDLPDGTFETGVWVVAEQHARTVEYVALHETQSEWSYRQGRVLGYRIVEHEGRDRVVFRVAPEARCVAWAGEGTMEKSYCWA